MIAAAAKLVPNVLAQQVLLTLCSSAMVAMLVPRLLLLQGPVANDATRSLLSAMAIGGTVSVLRTAWRLHRHRFVLRALALGSRSIETRQMLSLVEEPWRLTLEWLVPPLFALTAFAVLRPGLIDTTTAISLALLAAAIVAAGSLPLHVLVRGTFLRVIEVAPPETMRRMVEKQERRGRLARHRAPRRLVAALSTPVAMVAIGSALIASAHLRRADEDQREQTARALARAAFEPLPGVIPGAGVAEAAERARSLGFDVTLDHAFGQYRLTRGKDGILELSTPLDQGTAHVRFHGSTASVLSPESLALSLCAVATAALLGLYLGRALSSDLHRATRAVRLIAMGATLSEVTRIERPPRFKVVGRLEAAIERLAARFRVFASAQERAIQSREAATRMRGLFFASVSHDLKSPLNAILGFTALVRQTEELGPGQLESIDLIERRGRELLALIETILDAARVEAGQLKLAREQLSIADVMGQAISKGKDLGGKQQLEVVGEIEPGISPIVGDRVQLARAVATFIGHSLRTAERSPVRYRVVPAERDRLAIDVAVPSVQFSARQLEDMLDPTRRPGSSEPRGLALALSLARSIVELHGGTVKVRDRQDRGAVFCIRLPARRAKTVQSIRPA
jgi:signal transduction histidine kinase